MPKRRRLLDAHAAWAPGGLLGRVPRRWLIAGAASALAALLLGNRGLRAVISNSLLLRSFESELEGLKAEQSELRERIAAARDDETALEGAARRELDYLKPGEIEYRFPPPAKQ